MSSLTQDYRWEGDWAPFSEALGHLRPSRSYRSELNGISREFGLATAADYERLFIATGDLAEGTALRKQPELVSVVQAHWHASGANACRFARHISEHRQLFGWETWVMADRGSAADTAAALAERAHLRLEQIEVDVLSFVLPFAESANDLGEVVRHLGELESWNLTEQPDPWCTDLTLLGLTVEIDLDHWSEILGFAGGTPMAHTRRAPFTELAIRAKPPRRARQDCRANMADIPLDRDGATMAKWGQETKQSRAQRLGNTHEARGKARVTTVVCNRAGGE